MALPDSVRKIRVQRILTLYGQGVDLQDAFSEVNLRYPKIEKFLSDVSKYKLTDEWYSAKTLREAVEANLEQARRELPKPSNLEVIPNSIEGPVVLHLAENEAFAKENRLMLYKTGLVMEIFKHSIKPLSDCLESVPGMTEVKFFGFMRTYPMLNSEYQQILAEKEMFLAEYMKSYRLELMQLTLNAVRDGMKEQEVKETMTKTVHDEVRDLEGNLIGEKKQEHEQTKKKTVKPSPHTVAQALKLLGLTAPEDAIAPDTVVVLGEVTPDQLAEKKKAIQSRYQKFLEENPDYVE